MNIDNLLVKPPRWLVASICLVPLAAWSAAELSTMNMWPPNPSITTTVEQCSRPLHLPIHDNSPAGVSNTLTIKDRGTVQDVNVNLFEIWHPQVGDLKVTLTHGDTTVILLEQPPGKLLLGENELITTVCTGQNLFQLGIDDEANLKIEEWCLSDKNPAYQSLHPPTTTPIYISEQPLSVFDGKPILGDWTLTVSDNSSDSNDEEGTLNKWCLEYTDDSQANLSIKISDSNFDSDTTLNLGSASVNSVTSTTFNIAESGGAATLTVDATIEGPQASEFRLYADSSSPPDFLQPLPYETSIEPGKTHYYKVECQPLDAGLRQATLVLETNVQAPRNILAYDLTCIGVRAGYASSPAPGLLDFGQTGVKSFAPDQILTITESSKEANLVIQGSIVGNHTDDFSVSSTFPYNIGAGKNGQIEVKCKPLIQGVHTATLMLTTNDPSNAYIEYELKCEGMAAAYQSNPVSLTLIDLGTTQPGAPVFETIQVSNLGNQPLIIDKLPNESAALVGDTNEVFTLNTTLPLTLEVGSNPVKITVECRPPEALVYTATLKLTTNDPTLSTAFYPFTCKGTYAIEPLYTSLAPYPPDSTIDFGYVPTTAPATLMIKEMGNAPLQITGYQITGPDANDFSLETAFPINIANGSPAVPVTIHCTPTTTNNLITQEIRQGNLTFSTNATNLPNPSYSLKCQVPKAGYASIPSPSPNSFVNFNNPAIKFDQVMVGQSSTKILKVFEKGDAPLQINLADPPFTGEHPQDFRLMTAFPITINNGESIPVSITLECTPTDVGVRQAILNLVTNDPDNRNPSYQLRCNGSSIIGPGYSSTPLPGSLINFADTPMGGSSNQSFSIQEVGSVILDVGQDVEGNIVPPTITGEQASDFSILSPTFPFNIPNGKPPQTIILNCRPSGPGLRTATLTITSDHLYQTTEHTYELQCRGVPPAYASLPSPQSKLELGEVALGTSKTATLEIKESGGATLQVDLAPEAISGPLAADFAIVNSAFPLTIPDGGASQTVQISCTPSGGGTRTATLNLTSNDPDRPEISYLLECRGLVAGYNSSPPVGEVIKFDGVGIGYTSMTTIEIGETGELTLNVDLATISGNQASDFAVVSGFPLAIPNDGMAQLVTLGCTPSAVGTREASLNLTSNDPLQPTPVYSLECEGLPPAYSSTPTPLGIINVGKSVVGSSLNTTLEIQQAGSGRLHVDLANPPITGEDLGDFMILNHDFPMILPEGGEAQTVIIKCVPSNLGARLAILNLTSNDPRYPTVSYPLICIGVFPVYQSTPLPRSTLSFGNVKIGSLATVELDIRNEGNAPLQVELTRPEFTGSHHQEFVVVKPTFPINIPEGETQTVVIGCKPTEVGRRTATINLLSSDPSNPTPTYRLECYGTGDNPTIEPPPPVGQAILSLSVEGDGVGQINILPTDTGCHTSEQTCYFMYPLTTEITLTAEPAEGSSFIGWGGDCEEGRVSMDANKECIAFFRSPPHPLAVTLVGKGSVRSQPTKINCENNRGECEQTYPTGITVTLLATPDSGWEFQEWQGDCNSQGEVTMTNSKNCQAIFVKALTGPTVTLSIAKTGSGRGTVTSSSLQCGNRCSQVYSLGSSEILTATPEANSVFGGWEGDCEGSENPLAVTMNQAKTCLAHFEQLSSELYLLTVTKTGNGSVLSETLQCGETCQSSYPPKSTVELLAQADSNAVFTGWGGDCEGADNPLTLVMDTEKQCVANFAAATANAQATLTVVRRGQGSVESVPAGIAITPLSNPKGLANYPLGSLINLLVIPEPGYQFLGFSGDEACQVGQVLLKQAVSCVATFVSTAVPLDDIASPDNEGLPPCPIAGNINVICNYHNRWQLTDITVGERGNISNLKLTGNIDNQGWISNAKIQSAAMVTGGTLTGYIINQGLLKDLTFRGATLIGGTLSGMIASQERSSLIQDVKLAPSAHLTGGKLQGTIQGDAQQPALLEDLTILGGTFLNNVVLGKGVKLDDGVTLGPGVVLTNQQVATQFINETVDGQQQVFKDLTVGEKGKLSNALLQGTVINQGLISNATVQKGGALTGGLLSGKILNEGLLSNVEFQGTQLTGGTLAGDILNKKGILQDVKLALDTHLVGGKVSGSLAGTDYPPSARLENLTIMPNSQVENVIIGQRVKNQGILTNIEFQGVSLSGKLSGSVTNTRGGTLRDIFLEAGTHLSGGNLQGNIIGQGQVLIENVMIAAGSYLENVTIGDNVSLPSDLKRGPNVQFTHPPKTPTPEVPKEVLAAGINAQGEAITSHTTFTYELTSAQGKQTPGALLSGKAAKQVELSTIITLDPEHVGKAAEILTMVTHQAPAPAPAENYMRVKDKWVLWDKGLDQLEPIKTYSQLPKQITVPIFAGDDLSSLGGEMTLWVGYRLADGTLIFNDQTPLNFFIDGAPKSCVLYAVQDEKLNDTQLLKIDLSKSLWGIMQPLGPMYFGKDIEGLTLHPSNPDVLYATSGDNADDPEKRGYLYTVDRKTGALTEVGPTGFKQVSALGTDPRDQILWAWGEDAHEWSGLIRIDPLTGKGTPVKQFDPKDSMGGLAVSPDGRKIYTSNQDVLWVYDKDTQELKKACEGITAGRIEGLDMQPNGILLLGIDLDQTTTITAFDPQTCQVVKTRTYEGVDYNDIESVVWPAPECNDQSWLTPETD